MDISSKLNVSLRSPRTVCKFPFPLQTVPEWRMLHFVGSVEYAPLEVFPCTIYLGCVAQAIANWITHFGRRGTARLRPCCCQVYRQPSVIPDKSKTFIDNSCELETF